MAENGWSRATSLPVQLCSLLMGQGGSVLNWQGCWSGSCQQSQGYTKEQVPATTASPCPLPVHQYSG